MVDLQTADAYFSTQVVLNDSWVSADNDTKQRALNNASNMLYRYFRTFDPIEKPLPDEAVFEQAYFLLLVDETIQRASLGVTNVTVSGISITVANPRYPISPETKMIIEAVGGYKGVRLGRTVL